MKRVQRFVFVLLGIGAPCLAQEVDPARLALADAPRFLASPARNAKPIEPATIPALQRRVTLTENEGTLGAALDAITAQTGVRFALSSDVIALNKPVRVQATGLSLTAALIELLLNAKVDVAVVSETQLALVRRRSQDAGSIVGVVTKAGGTEPIAGASVTVEGTRLGALSDNEGRFRIDRVLVGRHRIKVQMLGYATSSHEVDVSEGTSVTLDVVMRISAITLDQVVATGTAFETRMRTVPNPISVITADRIEAKGASNITELLRGEIPGVMALSQGQDDYASRIYVRGRAGWTTGDYIKIYLDGVEVADPTYLSTIDPKIIERIEVVRGPQASVIYGSEAASGVLQIFTKKGQISRLNRPRIDLQTSLGAIESKYTPSHAGRPLTNDYNIGASGGGEEFSYRAGGRYATIGEWLTGYGSRTLGFSGGLRAVQGPFTAELTALWGDRDVDYGNTPILWRWPASASCPSCGNRDYNPNYDFALSNNTTGLSLGYQATAKWRHSLVLGNDESRFAYFRTEPTHLTPADTFVLLFNSESRRRSVRYHTAYETQLSTRVRARLTGGVDYWSYDVQGSSGSNLLDAFGTVRTSSRTSASFRNDGWWNAGYFGLAEVGFMDQLYLTLAARVEENPRLGEEFGRPVSPRVGVSWVRQMGELQMKLRGQLGKGVRPPPDVARAGTATATTLTLPNPEIGPEEKVGWDAGAEVYWWDGRGMIGITRYQEEGRNLIQIVNLDLQAVPAVRQYQNIGRVGSEGWEVEGRVELGRVTLQANYAYSDNVMKKLSNEYQATPDQAYWVGDRMEFVPTHSGGGTVTARLLRGSVSVNASAMNDWRSVDYIAYFGWRYGGEAYRGSMRDYYVSYSDALWKWNLRADQAAGQRITAFLHINNLTNNQNADLFNQFVTPGRTTVVGIRAAF